MANRRRDSRGSSSQLDLFDERVLYGCNEVASMVTSWTNENPGRRFYGCCNYKAGGCGFFIWFDDPLPKSAKELLISLRESKRKLAKENEMLKKQLVCLGISLDEVKSAGRSQQEFSYEICSSDSNVVDKTQKTNCVGDDELAEQLMKMTSELESLNNKNRRLKQRANSNKKANVFYKSLLIVACVGYLWLYWSFKARCNAAGLLSLSA